MRSQYLTALDAYLLARERYLAVEGQRVWGSAGEAVIARNDADRVLAQAGDVLEGELRRMMREETGSQIARTIDAESIL